MDSSKKIFKNAKVLTFCFLLQRECVQNSAFLCLKFNFLGIDSLTVEQNNELFFNILFELKSRDSQIGIKYS